MAAISAAGANVYANTRAARGLFVIDHVDQAPPRCAVSSRKKNVAYPTAL